MAQVIQKTIRLSAQGGAEVITTFKDIGEQGEAAFKKVKAAADSAGSTAGGGLADIFDDVAARATASFGPFDGVATRLVGFGPAGAAAVVGIGAVSAAFIAGIREAEQAELAYKRLDAVLKATGGSSGLTAKQVTDFAAGLETSTLASAEGVQAAAAALATFRNVSGETFTRAIALAQDLAAVFGGDVQGAAVQLGKALEDPIAGINALRRSGVSFSDSQKEVIKDLVETGRTAQAQQIILEALAGQVGGAGAGEADSLTGAFHRFTAEFGNMLEAWDQALDTGPQLTAVLDGLAAAAKGVGSFIGGATPTDRMAQIREEITALEAQAAANRQEGAATGGAFGRFQETQDWAGPLRLQIEALTAEYEELGKVQAATRREGEQAAVQGAVEQQEIRRNQIQDQIKDVRDGLEKAGKSHETEAEGIGRVNEALAEQLKRIEALRVAAREARADPKQLAGLAEAEAQARRNAANEIADLRKPRLNREAAEGRKSGKAEDKRESVLADIEAEIAGRARLAAALGQGVTAYDAERAALEAERQVRRQDKSLTDEEARSLGARLAASKALGDEQARQVAVRRQVEALEKANARPGIGVDAAGEPVDIAALAGLTPAALDEVVKRAEFVQGVIDKLGAQPPDVLGREVARATAAYDADLARDRALAGARAGVAAGEEVEQTRRLIAVQGESIVVRGELAARIEAENKVRAIYGETTSANAQALLGELTAAESLNQARAYATDILTGLLTPMQAFADEEAEIKAALDAEAISAEQAAAAREKLGRTRNTRRREYDEGRLRETATEFRATPGDGLDAVFNGAKAGLIELKLEAGTTADFMADSLKGGISSGIDGFAELSAAGELTFENIGKSLERFSVDLGATVLKMLLLKAITAGIGGTPTTPSPTTLTPGAGAPTSGQLYHAGGVVGDGTAPTRMVPSWAFAGAPRYHGGGVAGFAPDEVPAVLRKGERVIPEGGSVGGTSIQVIDQRGSDAPPVELQRSRGSDGREQVKMFIKGEVSGQMASGGLDKSVQGRFNVGKNLF